MKSKPSLTPFLQTEQTTIASRTIFMRLWIYSFSFLLALVAYGQGGVEFPNDPPASFTYSENVHDEVYADPDSFDPQHPDYLSRQRSAVAINASALITGFDISTIDELTPYEITIGDFSRVGTFSDVDGTLGANSFVIPIVGLTADGLDDFTAGNIRITWSSTRVSFAVTVNDADIHAVDSVAGINLSSVAGLDPTYYPNVNEPAINDQTLLGTISFGPFSTARTVYTTGSATAVVDPSGHFLDTLISAVNLVGSIDDVAPALVVNQPASNAVVTTNEVGVNGEYTISGTVSDIRRLDGQSFPGQVSYVNVRLGTGDLFAAQVNNDGTWQLANAIIQPGQNTLTVQASDGDNVTTVTNNFLYTKKGNLSVTCAADGYTGANGRVAGSVTGSFFITPSKKLTLITGAAIPQDSQGKVEAGQNFTVEAKPGPGSVFNGWIGTIKGNTVLNQVTAKITFETKPDLILTAHFAPDPFTAAITGTYSGLMTGINPPSRGLIQLKLGKLGSFTGKTKIGALALSFKGKVLASGVWFGTAKKGKTLYNITLNFIMGLGGDRQVNGTLTGGGLNSSLVADLADWHKPKKGDPGKLATAYAGTYNVLLPATATNADLNFPAGIGFGRVKITPLGKVSFVGKLGDGTSATYSALLAKRNSGPVLFPLYIGLDKKLGSVVGTVTYNSTLPDSDLTSTLDWAEPTTKATDPHAFSGQISLHGSRYTPPVLGERILLQSNAGLGKIMLTAPNYTAPILPLSAPLAFASAATLDASQALGPVGNFEMLQLKFNPKNGLFSGTYRDFILNSGNPATKAVVKFQGIATRKANGGAGEAGGVFTRGNRSGAVHLGP